MQQQGRCRAEGRDRGRAEGNLLSRAAAWGKGGPGLPPRSDLLLLGERVGPVQGDVHGVPVAQQALQRVGGALADEAGGDGDVGQVPAAGGA